jgi:hypothetical protein
MKKWVGCSVCEAERNNIINVGELNKLSTNVIC